MPKMSKAGIGHREVISNCETGNPPEGWESEGQLRISDLGIEELEN